MTQEELEKAIPLYVDERGGHITFVELMKEFPDEQDNVNGNAMTMKHPNIIIWVGMSEKIIKALQNLLKNKTLHFHPTTQMTYMIDGGGLNLPLVKQDREYKTERWLPVTIDRKAP